MQRENESSTVLGADVLARLALSQYIRCLGLDRHFLGLLLGRKNPSFEQTLDRLREKKDERFVFDEMESRSKRSRLRDREIIKPWRRLKRAGGGVVL